MEEKDKSNSNLTLEKLVGKNKIDNEVDKSHIKSMKHELKLPILKRKESNNPEMKGTSNLIVPASGYYLARAAKSFDLR